MKYSDEQIKEILMTDYVDGNLSAEEKQAIDEILSSRPDLMEFKEAILATSKIPFEKAQREELPAHLWSKIKEEISAEAVEDEEAVEESLLDRIKGWLFNPKPAFAMGTVMAVLILSVVTIRSPWLSNKINTSEPTAEVDYLTMLAQEEEEEASFETSIEEYFL